MKNTIQVTQEQELKEIVISSERAEELEGFWEEEYSKSLDVPREDLPF